jgi:hypothetical protein
MFVWFKKEKKLTGVEWMAAEFRTSKAAIEGSTLDEMYFAIPLAVIWKRFLDDFKGPAAFTSLSRDQQMSYFKTSLAHLDLRMQDAEFEAALPQRIFTFYLAFLVNGNTELASEAASFIDQYARKGWDLAFTNQDSRAGSTQIM